MPITPDGYVFHEDGTPVMTFPRRQYRRHHVCSECSRRNHLLCEGCECRWCARYLDVPNDIVRLAIFCLFLFTFTTAHAQHHVNLTWTGSAGAASYNVYRASGTCTGT